MHGHYVRGRSVPHERIHPKRPPTGPQPGTRAKTSNHRSDRALGPLRHRRVGTQSNLGPPPPPDVAVGPPSRPQRGPYTTPRTTSRRWRVQLCPWGVLDARWAVARAFIVALNQKSQNAKWADTNGHAQPASGKRPAQHTPTNAPPPQRARQDGGRRLRAGSGFTLPEGV